ncbi:hypothetical protein ACH5RR_023683 [Cinchona calisaya]|uniref:Uncharacterized protein n=1 Tax=Cinchona calisaya TaxID=153742 RepID=A0ABD2ZBD4_9GENT
MKCKKHVTDFSSTLGVCASCLRERLFVLIKAQEQAQAAQQAAASAAAAAAQDDRRKSEPTSQPPPLAFPRSVSPYISRRKSDTNSDTWIDPRRQNIHHRISLSDQRFYSTPQVGPNGTLVAAGSCVKKKSGIRFSFFANLFGSKSEKLDSDPASSGSGQDSLAAPAESSTAWFSAILPGRRKKKNRTFSLDESTIGGGQRRICRNPDRGMSPARYSDEEDEHCNNGSSGYSSESSQPWKQTPRRTPASVAPGKRCGVGGGGRPGQNRNVSGMTFCLSPLVRASPSRQWKQKGGVLPEMVVSGDTRVVPVKPHLSDATSFCKNRSRKLADFGRFHHNR